MSNFYTSQHLSMMAGLRLRDLRRLIFGSRDFTCHLCDGFEVEELPVNFFGRDMAQRIAAASDIEWRILFEDLRRSKRLSLTVREMNQLLAQQEHKDIATAAFRRIGLWHDECRT
jgi:hypothetical protein